MQAAKCRGAWALSSLSKGRNRSRRARKASGSQYSLVSTASTIRACGFSITSTPPHMLRSPA